MLRGLIAMVLMAVGASTQACDETGACTAVGGLNGVAVTIPSELFVTSGDVTIKVCESTACATAKRPLGTMPKDVQTPTGRGAEATFTSLDHKFSPGSVTVTATLQGPNGAVVAERTATLDLRRSYPNGEACDGDGYVSGVMTLRPADRV